MLGTRACRPIWRPPPPLGAPVPHHSLFSQDPSSPAHQIRLGGILLPSFAPPRAFSGIRAGKGGWRWLELSLPCLLLSGKIRFFSEQDGAGAACARGGGNLPGERGAATRRSACPFFSSSPGLPWSGRRGRGERGGWRRAPPRSGGPSPPAIPLPGHPAGRPGCASGNRETARGSRRRRRRRARGWAAGDCWRETRGDSHPPAALPRLP